MTAQTATDVANMINGADFAQVATTATGQPYTGIYHRGAGGALDYNDNRHRFTLKRADADNIALATVLTIDDIEFTVREKEPTGQLVNLVLESV